MIKMDDLEFNGEAFITVETKGTWIWEVKPVLQNNQWVLPEEYRDKPNASLMLNQVNGCVLPILLNMSKHEFNDTFKVFDKPRIYKVILEEIDTTEVIKLNPLYNHTSNDRMEMYNASQELPGFPDAIAKACLAKTSEKVQDKDLKGRPKK